LALAPTAVGAAARLTRDTGVASAGHVDRWRSLGLGAADLGHGKDRGGCENREHDHEDSRPRRHKLEDRRSRLAADETHIRSF
jgi:hypothetical protein